MNLSLDNILNLVEYTLLYAAIFSLVALGGMFSERSGVINIALEGIMVIGAITGAVVLVWLQRTPNPETMSDGVVNFLQYVQNKGKFLMVILSILASAIGGGIYSLLLAFASINLKGDQTIGGTALNMLATAVALVIARLTNITLNDKTSPKINYNNTMFKFGSLTFEVNWFFAVAVIALIISFIVLYKTKFGLRMRSCGEHPQASASLGINVYKMRYAGVIISGILGGIGGLAFVIPSVSDWNFEVGVIGAGFLSLSVMIFGQWKPVRIFGAALFFGLFRSLANTSDSMFPILVKAGITTHIFNMIPYILSIVVLAFTSKNSRAPKAEGIPYEKGMR